MRLTILRTAVLIVTLIAAPHTSADFEAGQSAWEAGNVDEALSQWRDAANEGDRRAMLELGRLYRQGLGVVQDYVEAHKWLNLAASRGESSALEERDALAAQMTPEQIAAAQQRAAAWQPGGAATEKEESSPAQDAGQPPARAIRAVQSLLAALGYQPGPADGVWGQGTKTAYRAFLLDMGLPQTDTLTPQALRTIQAAAEQQGVAQTGDGATTAGTTQTAAQPAADTPPPVSPDALHNAAQAGDIEVLKAAIAAGVDVNARDSRGWTALMYTVNKGYLLLVSELLEAEADVDVRAPDGATALFMAAAHGHTEIIELLMKAGADVAIKGPKGKTPVEVARARYGEVNEALENEEPTSVIALLVGKAWEDVDERTLKSTLRASEAAGEMISIPAGTFFRMPLVKRGDADEKRIHKVTVPAFKLGKYEVTFAQWDACVVDGGCDGYTPDDEGWGRGNRPVINVSWEDVQSFIGWLNNKIGGNYRLPTEAEWEYAARAGSKTRYSWGSDIGIDRANCTNEDSVVLDDWHYYGCGDQWNFTSPVGSFAANAWGLHDLYGNVEEWVQDCYNNDDYEGSPTDGSANTLADDGICLTVYRGGSWNTNLIFAYTGHMPTQYIFNDRGFGADFDRQNNLGFRLAQDE